ARDSHFIVHTVKNVYGMHPLLVTYNKHYNTRMGIRNLAYLRTLFGCDILTLTVSPEKVKKITRYTLKEMGSMYWHCIAGQTVFPVNIAVRFKIPLIIWGAHQGCDQVGMYSHMDEVEMTRKYRKDHDLMGYEAQELVKANKGISEDDVRQFFYPHDKEIERVGVRGIYLNNYVRWDSKKQHELMINKYGYETMKQHRTFDTYNDVDCFHYSDLHDYIKFLKHGYGKATDHACREIRLKRMTREEGIDLIRKYQDVSPDEKRLALFLDWVGMTRQELFDCVNKNRNRKIWEKIGKSKWELSDSVVNHINDPATNKVRLQKNEDCEFIVTPLRDSNSKEDKYILIGRGWVDKE
ncbi:MAG: N-acetyl sugar amidotransferase, partial [Candidatus Auribacterota bacterium]|nr:N-acetyl sugar amidotransferase [Candidatus Auribacterota bacterium]